MTLTSQRRCPCGGSLTPVSFDRFEPRNRHGSSSVAVAVSRCDGKPVEPRHA